MPKRVIDGEAVRSSDKIASCMTPVPATTGVYYERFYTLADANGSFEITSLRVIHAKVSMNLPFLTQQHVETILREFEEKGLLFTWSEHGKRYAHWTGCERAGLLPPPSHRASNYEKRLAEPVPKDLYDKYIQNHQGVAGGSPPDALVGSGFGIGSGIGSGSEKIDEKPAPSAPPLLTHPLFLIWQEEHRTLPTLRALTQGRLRKCRSRANAHAGDPERFLAEFREAVRKATQNAFLTGSNDRGWKASFDWFIANDENYSKVLEGIYDRTKIGGNEYERRQQERRRREDAVIDGFAQASNRTVDESIQPDALAAIPKSTRAN